MKEVLLLITDGFADWEASYVSAELNKPTTGFKVKTIAIDKEPKTSMGGLSVLPDFEIGGFAVHADVAMLIIPGGTGWNEEKGQLIQTLVGDCLDKDIPVAAICDATTFLGNHGFLDHVKHTGNTLEYLKARAPRYKGDDHYVNAQAVSDRLLITANGSGAVEFSRHILAKLQVYDEQQLNEWYGTFKNGIISEK
ncbi:type 1 glutamine amidotransferase family protein [Paenibacillus contaminans]|uniref:Glutamine amidotransferase n=1 Tax=Paenibacillus contaminans TaxID=450362 RepID=A0A329LUY4_9BACL|nr:type 1 glutamine amidotransferase family protein [Paenibacillus contaminans]RAV11258.1 glutamine amidotransferase [Paenibacillus contaminans]